jgi:hypothetical protein
LSHLSCIKKLQAVLPHTFLPALLNIKNVYIPSEAVTIIQFVQHLLENAIGKMANIVHIFQITKRVTLCTKWKNFTFIKNRKKHLNGRYTVSPNTIFDVVVQN